MNATMKIGALAVLCAAQLGAAAWSIVRYESTLRSGAAYLIRTEPVDPSDAFRGRYVAVSPMIVFARPIAPETEQLIQQIQNGEPGYALLATDAQGFAIASAIVAQPPAKGDYLKITHIWPRWNTVSQPGEQPTMTGYSIVFAFDRYYMNEAAAPAAEQHYRDVMRRNATSRAWLTVRVKDGSGVIEGLFIDGVPIEKIAAPK
jgi:uncharacterized membrane-anchored protein